MLALLYVLSFVLQKSAIQIPFVHSYFDDLVCAPVILFPALLFFRRFVYYRNVNYIFPTGYLLFFWVVFSLYFEVILPNFNSSFTADPLDMLMYAIGIFVFVFMQKPFGKLIEK